MLPANADQRLTALYEHHYHEVLAYCVRRIGMSEAEDVTADVFAIAWKKVDTVAADSARALLYGIARGVLANRWRAIQRRGRLARRVSGLRPVVPDRPDEVVVRRTEDGRVVDALSTLRPTDQEVLRLAAWEGLTAPEIATVLAISVSAAEQRLHRAKRRFASAAEPLIREVSPRAAAERGGR